MLKHNNVKQMAGDDVTADDVRCIWAIHMWSACAKIQRKNKNIKAKLHALSNDLGALGVDKVDPAASQGPPDATSSTNDLSNGGENARDEFKTAQVAPVTAHVSTDGAGQEGTECSDVEVLRGRILDLESAMQDVMDSNHKLRQENSEAEAGLGKALELLQTLQGEKVATRKQRIRCGINLAENARAFWSVDIPRVDADISPADFYRDFVSTNRPCILRADAKASRTRSLEWIISRCKDSVVTVNCTPNGMADAVMKDVFVKPFVEKMPFSAFMERLTTKADKDVVYVSEQNDSLRREFPQLYQDPPVASAFEKHPLDAVNFWLGDERSYTSFHKDHYENMYSVLCGTKVFWLAPPSAAWCVYEKLYPVASWTGGPGNWKLEAEEGEVPWIPVDARSWAQSPEYRNLYPDFTHAEMQRVEVEAGESFYLPSLWYHAASQTGTMAAINYWFDMQFDSKWVYYQYLREMNNLP